MKQTRQVTEIGTTLKYIKHPIKSLSGILIKIYDYNFTEDKVIKNINGKILRKKPEIKQLEDRRVHLRNQESKNKGERNYYFVRYDTYKENHIKISVRYLKLYIITQLKINQTLTIKL